MDAEQAKAMQEMHARKLVLDTLTAHRAPPLDGSEGQDARTRWAVYMRSVQKLWPFEIVSMDAELGASLSGAAWEQFNEMRKNEGESDMDFATRVIDTFATLPLLNSQEGYVHIARLMSWKRRPGESVDQVFSCLKREISKLPWEEKLRRDILYMSFLKTFPYEDRRLLSSPEHDTPEKVLAAAKTLEAQGPSPNVDVDPVAIAMAQVALAEQGSRHQASLPPSGDRVVSPDEIKRLVESSISESKVMTDLAKQLESLKSLSCPQPSGDMASSDGNGGGRKAKRRGKGGRSDQLNAVSRGGPSSQQPFSSGQSFPAAVQQSFPAAQQQSFFPAAQQQSFPPAVQQSFPAVQQPFPAAQQPFPAVQQPFSAVQQFSPAVQQPFSAPSVCQSFQPAQQRQRQVWCQLCHQPGHAAPLCSNFRNPQGGSSWNGQNNSGNLQCFHCQQSGHMKRNCPLLKSGHGQRQPRAQFSQVPVQQAAQQFPVQQFSAQHVPMQQQLPLHASVQQGVQQFPAGNSVPASAQQMGNFRPVS